MPETRTRRRVWPWAVLAAVVVLVVVGVLALDALLLSRARAYAADFGQELGREIRIGGLRTKFLGGLGVRVSDVAIGPGAGEDAPILELRRAEVEADLLLAARTRGRELHVREAVLEGLRVNVIRFEDGTTNAERLAQRLEERAAKEPAPEPEQAEAPADLSSIRVGRAAVENARVAFLDRSTPGAKELAIDDLDVEVKDLAAGQPLLVTVRAAVLAAAQNFALELRAPPLPSTLVPTPESVILKVEPAIDLAPLAPFVPASVGLLAGRFQANLDAKLGGAVPGGEGPTKIVGALRALGLRFSGAEGGRALDVVLDADLEADAEAGDLRIGKLLLTAGPVKITGSGRATGLLSSTPKAEGLSVVGEGLDPAALAAYYPPLRETAREIAGPASFTLTGSGTGEAQALELRVELRPVRLAIPEVAAKAAGAPMSLVARIDAAGGGERARFDASADLAGLDLRPGGSLAKGPGDPLALRVQGNFQASGDTQAITISRADLTLLADRLTGTGQVALGGTEAKPTTRFDLAVSGDRLDLDRLLIQDEAAAKAEEPAEPADPKAFEGLSGTAQVKLGTVRMQKLDFKDVVARVKVVEDEVTVEEGRLEAFGGRVSAAGTRMKLAHPKEPFRIAAELTGVQLQQATSLFSPREVVSGKMNGKIDLNGTGLTFATLAPTLTGLLAGSLQEGVFHGRDLVASVAGPLSKALPFAGGKFSEGGVTNLGKNLPFSFRIANGLAELEKPLTVTRSEGNLEIGGGVKLDGTLQMPVTFALSPELISRLTGGRAKLEKAVPVTFDLVGPAWKPSLANLRLEDAAKTIARDAASQAAGRALGLDGSVEDAAAAKRAEAEAAVKAKGEEARARAESEAEKARKKAEEEAKKRLKGLFGK
jgi:AsmA protein